jgi:hypothetical protein
LFDDPWRASPRRNGIVHFVGGPADGETKPTTEPIELGHIIDEGSRGKYKIVVMEPRDDDPPTAEFWAELVEDPTRG